MDWLKNIFSNELAYHFAIAVAVVVAFSLLARTMRRILGALGKKLLARTATVLDDRILNVILSHVRPLMVLTGLHIAVREIRKGISETDITPSQVLDYCDAILYLAVVVLVVKVVLNIVKEVIHWYLEQASKGDGIGLRMTLGPLTDKIVAIVVGMVAIIVVLDHFGINIGSLLVSLGVGSLAIALAAQDTLANMIAGFVILVDRPFRVGDRIQMASGEVGDVTMIGLRSTRIVNLDANMIIVPNAELVKGKITNYSYPLPYMRILVEVGVAYGTDPERVRSIMTAQAAQHEEVLKDPAPRVLCTRLGESGIEFTLIARIKHYDNDGLVKAQLRERIYSRLVESGIEIPFTQRVVHMKGNP
jgi:small-conductance mechanosensitive channel